MPPRGSTNTNKTAASERENVQYIVRGSNPVFATLSVICFILLVTALTLQHMELTSFYDYHWSIFFPPPPK